VKVPWPQSFTRSATKIRYSTYKGDRITRYLQWRIAYPERHADDISPDEVAQYLADESARVEAMLREGGERRAIENAAARAAARVKVERYLAEHRRPA
jgi:hypothetical protein